MISVYEIYEAFQAGKFPEIDDISFQNEYNKILQKAVKIADVRKNYALYNYSDIYLLVKDNTTIAGMLRLTDTVILDTDYYQVEGIYVPIQYRKTSAVYYLLYAVKETVDKDVIADGAIFTDGQKLVDAIKKHNMFYVFDLNKQTGEIKEISKPITSIDHCYLFRTTKLGFGKQMFIEGMGFTWYSLFGEIEEVIE